MRFLLLTVFLIGQAWAKPELLSIRQTWSQEPKGLDREVHVFFRSLIAKIGETYAFADMKRVTLIGTSNGAALIHRLLIEVDEDLFQKAVPSVASMIVPQFHDDSFWMPKDGNTDVYTVKKVPRADRQILYIHGSKDQVVPFKGVSDSGNFSISQRPRRLSGGLRHRAMKASKRPPRRARACWKRITKARRSRF